MFTSKKKKYFLNKLDGIQKMIWDFEFKKEKTLAIREEVRREYDGLSAKLSIVLTRIASQLKDPKKVCEVHNPAPGTEKVHKDKGTCACEYIENAMPVAEIESLYDSKEVFTRDLERYKLQMKQMDVDMHGSKKTNEYPDGVDGIDQTIEGLRDLKGMTVEYIKKI